MKVDCYSCWGNGYVQWTSPCVSPTMNGRDLGVEECDHCSGTGLCSCEYCGERYAEAHPGDLVSRIIAANAEDVDPIPPPGDQM